MRLRPFVRLELHGDRLAVVVDELAQTATMMAEQQPDILILDIAMPDGDGIDAIPQLQSACVTTRIVVLTMFAEPAVVRRALEADVYAYLLKAGPTRTSGTRCSRWPTARNTGSARKLG